MVTRQRPLAWGGTQPVPNRPKFHRALHIGGSRIAWPIPCWGRHFVPGAMSKIRTATGHIPPPMFSMLGVCRRTRPSGTMEGGDGQMRKHVHWRPGDSLGKMVVTHRPCPAHMAHPHGVGVDVVLRTFVRKTTFWFPDRVPDSGPIFSKNLGPL